MYITTDRRLFTREAWTIKGIGSRSLTVTGKRTIFSRGKYEVLFDSYRGERLAEIKGNLAEARDGMRKNEDIWRELKLLNAVARAIKES